MRHKKLFGLFILGGLMISSLVFAQVVDLITPFSARSSGMGNTYSAFVDDLSALYSNPAGLAKIEKANVYINYTHGLNYGKAPLGLAATTITQTDSELTNLPFFNVGFGYRVHEWVTLGVATYTASGLTSKYANVDLNAGLTAKEFSTMVYVININPSFALTLPYNVRFGFTYLIGYNKEDLKGYNPNVAGTGFDYLDLSLDGWNFKQFKFGFQYDPTEDLSFGLFYRTPTTTTVKGDVTYIASGTATETPLSGQTTIKSVDMLNFGTAYKFLNKKALVAFDFSVLFFDRINDVTLTLTDATGAAAGSTVSTLNWSNEYVAGLGGEYWLTKEIPVRLGYSFYSKFVPKDYANALYFPPGHAHGITAGTGYKFGNWGADFSYNISFRSGTVPSTVAVATTIPGDYSGTLHMIGLNMNYFF